MAAITSVANEVGRRCHSNEDVKLRAELQRSVDRFDAYMLANGVSQSVLTQFKERQGAVKSAPTQLCTGDAADLYNGLTKPGAIEELRKSVDELTRLPGRPEWGDCL